MIRLMDNGKKRCQSRAPLHAVQCEKPKKHSRSHSDTIHSGEGIVWGNDGGHSHQIDIDDSVSLARFLPPVFNPLIFGTKAHEAMEAAAPTEDTNRQQAFGEVDPAVELAEWWREIAETEIAPTVDKAVEYGSTDLIDIGAMLLRTMNRPVDEEEAAELGVFFYLIGKIARWQSAIQRGERPSDDTLFDIGVYVRMAQRIRHSGGWPGVEA